MVESLKTIYLIDKYFTFYQRKKGKFIYKNQNIDTNELTVLELEFSEIEKRITKIDIYFYKNTSLWESLHITKGIDDIIQIDYYPNEAEMVNIDNKKKLCNINIFKTYSIEDENIYEESCQLILNRKGHKKKKILTNLSLMNHLYVTQEKRSHYIFSPSMEKLNKLTESIVVNILELEKKLFEFSVEQNIPPENISISSLELQPAINNDIVENYPKMIYVYDRNYELIGIRNQAIIYQNTEDNIMELEIYFSDDMEKIKEVRILEYVKSNIDGVESDFKTKIIRLVPDYDSNMLRTMLCSKQKESMLLNYHTVQNVLLNAIALVSEEGKIEKMYLNIDSSLGKFILTNSETVDRTFVDKNNQEFLVSSNSYGMFYLMTIYGFGIINRLEKNLINKKISKISDYKKLRKVL